MAERDLKLSQVGYRPTLERVTEVYGEGYEAARPTQAAAPPVADPGAGPAFADGDAAFPDQAALDAATDALSADALNAQARAMLKPILDKLSSGADPTELLGWLAEAYPGMDATGLQEQLERMLFVAVVWGRLNAEADLAA